MRLLNVSIYRKVHHQIFRNKRHLTKDISKYTSRTLDFLSNVIEMKFKSKKLPKNRRSPEAIQVQSDMSHMRTRIGSRSKWHGVPEKETSACLKNRLDRLEKGIHVFLRTSLTSRKEFPSFKGSHDRARRRKHRPNCWPKFVIQTYIYIYIYIYFHTGSVGGQAADSQERGSLRLAPITLSSVNIRGNIDFHFHVICVNLIRWQYPEALAYFSSTLHSLPLQEVIRERGWVYMQD